MFSSTTQPSKRWCRAGGATQTFHVLLYLDSEPGLHGNVAKQQVPAHALLQLDQHAGPVLQPKPGDGSIASRLRGRSLRDGVRVHCSAFFKEREERRGEEREGRVVSKNQATLPVWPCALH